MHYFVCLPDGWVCFSFEQTQTTSSSLPEAMLNLLLICMLYVYHKEVIADMIVTHPVKLQCKCHSFNHDHEDAGIIAA
jgi:hypothetical protein